MTAASAYRSHGRTARRRALELALSPAPMDGDNVLEVNGAHVFLDEIASVALDDKSLDAAMEGGEISFGIVEQDEEGPEPPL